MDAQVEHLAHHLQRLAGLLVEVDLRGCASRMISRPLAGLRRRYRCCTLIGGTLAKPAAGARGRLGHRILIFHGYLLSARAPRSTTHALRGRWWASATRWTCSARIATPASALRRRRRGSGAGRVRVRAPREPVRRTAYRPEIGAAAGIRRGSVRGDRSACLRALQRRGDRALHRRQRGRRARAGGALQPDVALANHLDGPAILARALAHGVPYAVKVQGSAWSTR